MFQMLLWMLNIVCVRFFFTAFYLPHFVVQLQLLLLLLLLLLALSLPPLLLLFCCFFSI